MGLRAWGGLGPPAPGGKKIRKELGALGLQRAAVEPGAVAKALLKKVEHRTAGAHGLVLGGIMKF